MSKHDLPAAAGSLPPCVIGVQVYCAICFRAKAPHGRSVPDATYGTYCVDDESCSGYSRDPKPGCLWPGETSDDFGYAHCLNATEPVLQALPDCDAPAGSAK